MQTITTQQAEQVRTGRRKQRPTARQSWRQARKTGARRRGVVAVYVALGTVVFLAAAALSVDVSFLYSRRAQAQRTADAAALAGAYQLTQNVNDVDGAKKAALAYAKMDLNGAYDPAKGATVNVETPYKGDESAVHVTVSRNEPLFFAKILPLISKQPNGTVTVGASSTAAYDSSPDVAESGADYGSRNAAITYSVYGPNALRNNGDLFSTKYSGGPNDNTPNPSNANFDGYNFVIKIPANYDDGDGDPNTNLLQVEIFDPDTWNPDGQRIAGPSRSGGTAYDEIRAGHDPSNDPNTRTLFRLIDDSTNPPTLIAGKTAAFKDELENDPFNHRMQPPSDQRWVSPRGWERIDLNKIGAPGTARELRLQVTTDEGSSENGFNLRAGPPQTDAQSFDIGQFGQTYSDRYGRISKMGDDDWQNTYGTYRADGTRNVGPKGTPINGTTIAAQGRVPINFNRDSTTDINLGYVPAVQVKDPQLTVTRFDTDVPSTSGQLSVYYTYKETPDGPDITPPSQATPKELNADANNNKTQTDILPLTQDYLGRPYAGGYWTAHYLAGNNDTSSWSVAYSGKGRPKNIRITN